jgi:DNA-binding response OmpR family regulator
MTPGVAARVLARLVLANGAMVPAPLLELAAYGPDGGPADARGVLWVTICRLRRALPPGAITTHHGQGYSLSPVLCRRLRMTARVDTRLLAPVE